MSNPYGPPAGGGQQGPGSYPGQNPAGQNPAWGPAQGAGPYGAPPSYGQPAGGPGAPSGPGYGPGPSYGGPGQGGPSQGGPGAGGPAAGGPGSDGPGQWGGPPPSAGSSPKAPRAPKAPRPPRASGAGPDLAKILPLVSLVLGVIAFIAGFLNAYSAGDGDTSVSVKVFGGGPSYLPILLLVVGLLAVAPLAPGGKKYALVTVVLSVAGLLGAIGSLVTSSILDIAAGAGSVDSSKGFGLILLLIVAILLVATTGFGWLTEAGVLKPAGPSGAKASAGPGQSSYGSSAPSAPAAPVAPAGQGSYGGYPPGGYQPPTDGYQPYGQPSSEPATSGQAAPASAPSTGSTPSVEPPTYGGSYGQGTSTGQHGRDDGPPPDVTQQVRF